jgi:hypothetical protein
VKEKDRRTFWREQNPTITAEQTTTSNDREAISSNGRVKKLC